MERKLSLSVFALLSLVLLFQFGWIQGNKASAHAELGYKQSLTPLIEKVRQKKAHPSPVKQVDLVKGDCIPVAEVAAYLPPISYQKFVLPVAFSKKDHP